MIHHKKWNKDKEINDKLKLNDDINNLECMTRCEHNNLHSSGKNSNFYGVDRSGENSPKSKLISGEVKKIRHFRYIKKWSYQKISSMARISASNVAHIVKGHTWNPDKLTKEKLVQQAIKENQHGII